MYKNTVSNSKRNAYSDPWDDRDNDVCDRVRDLRFAGTGDPQEVTKDRGRWEDCAVVSKGLL